MSHGVLKKKGECLENDSGMSVKALMESLYKRLHRKKRLVCADFLVDVALGNVHVYNVN